MVSAGAVLVLVSVAVALTVFPSSVSAGQDIWTTNALHGYQVNAVALDPQSPSIVYAGTQEGLLISLNGGGKWSAMKGLSDSITAIVHHPQASGWLYVIANGTVYKTTDYGGQWAQVGEGMIDHARLFVLDPKTPDTIYVTTESGLFRSHDGGESWAGAGVPAPGRALLVAFDPRNPDIVYVVIEGQGLFKSTDGGKSWLLAGDGLPQDSSPSSLAINPQRPNILYAARGDSHYQGQVYKSMDGGESWTAVGQPEGQWVSWVFIAPQAAEVLYGVVWEQGLYRSPDGGVSWALIGKGLPESPQITRLVGDPQNAKVVYAVANGQVYKTYDGGENWIRHTLPGEITALVALPASPETLCITIKGGGVYKTTDGGSSWVESKEELPEAVSNLCPRFDPQAPDIAYAGTAAVFYRSTDGGGHWEPINLPPNTQVLDIATDPKTSATIYVISPSGLLKSANGGESWTLIALPVQGFDWASIAIVPQRPTTLYIATRRGGQITLLKSTDGGANWQKVIDFEGGRVVFHPRKPSTILVPAGRQGVAASTDGGKSWERKNWGLPSEVEVWQVAVHPTEDVFFLRTDQGVFVSTDLDVGWATLDNGWPPNRQPSVLAVTADDPPQLFVRDGSGTLWQYTVSVVPQPPAPTPTPSPSPTITPTPCPTPTRPTPTPWPTATPYVTPTPTDTRVLQRATPLPTATPKAVTRAKPTAPRKRATPARQPEKAKKLPPLPSVLAALAGLGLLMVGGGAVIVLLQRRKSQLVHCAHCGAGNLPDSRFCFSCGKELPQP